MDATQAQTQLASMLGDGAEPVLTVDELTTLLALAARADRFGRYPTDATWENTYALNAAAAEGWRWKAAKVAGDFKFTVDGNSYDRDQVHTHCLAMAAEFLSREGGQGTLNTGGYAGYSLGELTTDPYGNPIGFGGVLL